MKYNLDKSNHSVYCLQYHLIICTKYRRKVLEDKVINELKERILDISENHEIQILSQETDKDHIHILFRGKPTTDLSKFINAIKTGTSKAIRHRYPKVKKKLREDSFWSRSYCLISTGEVTLNALKKYVESQGKNEDN